jgi:hypothetical protein
MISLDLGLWKSGAKIVYDTDAAAFFSAASINDITQKAAVNQLVLDLKSYSLWSKMVALYPFVGGSATSHKYNLKDPRDLDAAFRLTFNGGWTHASTGALPNGTNGYADTFFTPSVSSSLNSGHCSYYIRSNFANIKNNILAKNTTADFFGIYNDISRFYPSVNDGNGLAYTPSVLKGMFASSRIASTQVLYMANGTTGSLAQSSTSLVSVVVPIGCSRYATTLNGYANNEFGFASLGTGLTTSELGNLNTAVVAFQTTLGRNV